MSFPRFLLLALALCGTVGGVTLVTIVYFHAIAPPDDVYVLAIQEIEVAVVDHDLCVELLAAEVAQPPSNCYSCHTGAPSSDFRSFTIEVAPDNGADSDTGQMYWAEESVTAL